MGQSPFNKNEDFNEQLRGARERIRAVRSAQQSTPTAPKDQSPPPLRLRVRTDAKSNHLSKIGCSLVVLGGITTVFVILAGQVVGLATLWSLAPEESAAAIVVGIFALLALLMVFLGLALGVYKLVRDKKPSDTLVWLTVLGGLVVMMFWAIWLSVGYALQRDAKKAEESVKRELENIFKYENTHLPSRPLFPAPPPPTRR
ncbi:MAG: hypothetical protein ACPL7D_04150 [Candidatus Sumerlaeaceae bacterium]